VHHVDPGRAGGLRLLGRRLDALRPRAVAGLDAHEQLAGAAADVEHARGALQRQRVDGGVDRRLAQRVGERDAAMRDRGDRRAV
jgi:hypothetical protein